MTCQRVGWAVLGAGVWLAACGVGDKATASLSGQSEVPPVSTRASGTVTATLEGNTLTVSGTFSDLESDLLPVVGSPAHVHEGRVGENGGVFFNLTVESTDQRSGAFRGSRALSAAELQKFRNGLYYVNVHTEGHPSGEIRGQLEP